MVKRAARILTLLTSHSQQIPCTHNGVGPESIQPRRSAVPTCGGGVSWCGPHRESAAICGTSGHGGANESQVAAPSRPRPPVRKLAVAAALLLAPCLAPIEE